MKSSTLAAWVWAAAVVVGRMGIVTGCGSGGAGGSGGEWKEAAMNGEVRGVRVRESFNLGWRFQKGEPAGVGEKLAYEKVKPWVMASGGEFAKDKAAPARPAGEPAEGVELVQAGFDDSSWRTLDLPHDWAIEGPFKQELEGSTGKREFWGPVWYRKHFTLPQSDAGKRICVDFDGAMSYASVWVNGRFAGGWPYGYASFRVDVTDYVKPGADNVIAVRLDSPKESSRWYPGAGIYRNVWLVKTSPVHVGQWGTYVTTPEVSKDSAAVVFRATVKNEGKEMAEAVVRTEVFERGKDGRRSGRAVANWGTPRLRVDAGQEGTFEARMEVARPKLWDIKSPNMYVAVTTVVQGGKVVDEYETPFGIRTIKWDADKGFLLNGERVAIQGVCNHHDLGPLGSAFYVRAAERQIEILKEMGCNAIRTSHNPPAPELLDLCDRMGIVVMDESFDCWAQQKRPGDYHLLFPDWHERDWRAELRRDRNHPCVVIWSTGNEVREQGDPKRFGISEELTRIAHEEDPTRPTSVAANNPRAASNGFAKTIDLYGFNYKPDIYAKFHKDYPQQPVYGSETASCVSTRGEYFFPVEENKDKGKANFQVSSYDLYAPRWAWPPDVEFKGLDMAAPYAAGEFVWTGFDYIGEPTPFGGDESNMLNMTDPKEKARIEAELKQYGKIKVPSRSSYFGIVDLCGFKKDRFFIYQARWRPEVAMVHVLPHWNWPERVGQVTPVHAYTSGDEAELFINGKSMGRKKRGQYEYRVRWDEAKYEPGEVKVVAYKGGKKWAEETVKSTGGPAKLKVEADRKVLSADGKDLVFVTVTVEDKEGRMVPRSKTPLKFAVEGAGELVAVDNGDPTCHLSFQSSEYPAFNGLCLAVVRAKPGSGGAIRVKVSGEGVAGDEVAVRSR